MRVLEELKRRGRKPEATVIDNGTEFTSRVVNQWAYEIFSRRRPDLGTSSR